MKNLLTCLLLFLNVYCYGTHIHAGELSYKLMAGNIVEFNVILYCDSSSNSDSTIVLYCGDGTQDTLTLSGTQFTSDSTIVKRSGTMVHIYNGNGSYQVYFTIYNRSANINNIPKFST